MDGIESRQLAVENGLLPDRFLESDDWKPVSLQERMEWLGAAGMSIAVIDDQEIVWEAGYGAADAVEGTPVLPGTLFLAGSISKSVNAVAVMRLVEEGQLGLDDDVNDRLRSWKVPANRDWQPVVTLRQLLSHTGGTTVHGFPGYASGSPLPTTIDVLEGRRPAVTMPVRVNNIPGLGFRYSGGGTTIIQQLLEEVSGQPYPDLIREVVLEPAGMTSSSFDQPPKPPLLERCASGHGLYGNRVNGKWHLYPEMAAAGLWTTAGDLARFALDIQRSLRGEPALLGRDSAEEMLTPPPGSPAYALGFAVEGSGSGGRFGHNGADEGFYAALDVFRECGKGAVVMTNFLAPARMIGEVENAIASTYAWPGWLKPPVRSAGTADTGHTGLYSGENLQIRVFVDQSSPWAEVAGQPALRLMVQEDGTYRCEPVNASLTIDGDHLILEQDSRRMEATRIEERR